ncbi:C2 domain-containing protein [Scheffersomyces xylosifermentans]|uniref:C2 domain-containing protein n=1 Tax=Scheffersomyces xylosifermentans TaxID=1304137 RepID=UPI00315C59E1
MSKTVNPIETIKPPEQLDAGQPLPDTFEGDTVAPNPNATIEKPAPAIVETPAPKQKDRNKSVVSVLDLKPSEDFDLSNVKTKPLPRQPGQPTFRGWKEVGHWEHDDALTEDDEAVDLLSKSSVFDQYLPGYVFGDWYHNTGYLVVGALLSWIIGWFRFSVAPLFFVMVVFAVLYRASVKKYRVYLREQAQREFSVKTIETDFETMDWSNNFLEKFWIFLEPSISQIVCEQVNPILASSPAPAFVKSLWIDSFSAGTKPPRVDCVKTLHGTNDDVVVMDWGFSFTPNSLADANTKQLKNKVNQRLVVKAEIFGITIPVVVSDVSFSGLARIRMRMMSSFPHVETINVSMLEAPKFDFNSKILSESPFIWEVLSFPGLYPFINEMVKKYVGSVLFAPLSFQLNIQQLLAGNALDSSIGVLAITADSARGLKGFTTIGNTLDPYLTFGFKKEVLAKTSIKDDTNTPCWKETVHILVKSLSEPLNITVVDFNDFRKDRQVGTIQFDLESLLDDPKQSGISAPFIRNNKPVGELLFGLHYMPTIEAEKSPDGAVIPPPDLNTGIARIEIAEARHLKSGGSKPATTYAELYFNKDLILTTSVQKKTNTPSWNSNTERIVDNRSKAKVKILVKDKDDKVVGQILASLNELIDATQVDQTWFPLAKGGEVRVSASWKPVNLEYAEGSRGYTPPIGTVRVSIEKAEDLRNLESIGKVDPYARLLVNGFQRARTVACDSTLNPTWNEVHYVTVTSPNQKLTIDVMDVERHSPDRTLGAFDVRLNDIIRKDESGKYVEYIDHKKRNSRLIHRKGPKGSVTYSLSFYPTLPVMTLEDYREEEEEKKANEKEAAEKAAAAEKEGKKAEPVPQAEEEAVEDHGSKLRLSLEELVNYKSGVFVYEFIDAKLSKNGVYIQAFFDNHGYDDFVTPKLEQKQTKIGATGDVVIKELDWSSTTFRVTKNKDNSRAEKAIAETTIPTLQLLKNSYSKANKIQFMGDGESFSFNIQCSWIPVLYEEGIPPQDSVNNSGRLSVEVVRAENLIAADRSGKSDPYIELYLNTDKDFFFKTKKVKKTLDPTFGETGEVQVANKYDSVLKVVAMDWDIGPEQDDLLGIGFFKLSDVDFNSHDEYKVPLEAEEGGDGGNVYLKFSFKKEVVINVRRNSTTNIGGAFGAVGGVGIGAGKGVVKGVGTIGKGLGGGVKVFKKGLSLGKSSSSD